MASYVTRGFCVLAGTLALAGVGASSASAAPLSSAEKAARTELLGQMNATRARFGLRPLTMSRVLNRPAVLHSQYLARTGRFTHTGSDGRPFYVRLYRTGFSRTRAVGENLGVVGGCSLKDGPLMIREWLRSPSHRVNLLNPQFRVVGLAVVQADNCSQTIYTTDFGG